MRAILNGHDSGTLVYAAHSDKTLTILLLDDDGVPVDITGDTVSLELHEKMDRSDTATTETTTLTTASSGHATAALADDGNFGALAAGSYYLWVKHVASGGDVTYANEAPFTFKIV